jgi:hypothetical protein
MVRVGIGVEGPHGESRIPVYDSESGGRTVVTIYPFAISLGPYKFEPSIAVTSGDIGEIYRRLRP